jgi:hypothetical protein
MKTLTYRAIGCAALGLLLEACGGQLDAGYDVPHGPLPVDERSALLVINDGPHDNWQGEYAALLAATKRARLVGIIVNPSVIYPDLEDNVLGFRQMVERARASGMQFLPDPTASVAPTLVRPKSGVIEDTVPNRSEGARLILDAASRYGTSVHPLAIATGSPVTDVADAYLMDPTLAERAVLVASLGTGSASGAVAGVPNGDLDSWATFIAATRMRYVQVNGYYDQLADVPDARVAELPHNPFGDFIAGKRAEILDLQSASDQVSLLASVRPWFAQGVTRMRAELGDDGVTTVLVPDAAGQAWHVAASDSTRARDELWSALKDPATFR